MSDRIQKMKEYGQMARALNTKKTGSQSKVYKVDKGKSKATDPPSYRDQDQQKGVQDTNPSGKGEDEKIEEAEKKIEKEEKKDPGKKEKAEKKEETNTGGARMLVNDNFAPFLGALAQRTFNKKKFRRESTYIPNALTLERILFATHNILSGNQYLEYHHKNYLSIFTTTYYSVLFFIQILRCQAAAKVINKADSSWLRGFFRIFPEESLPIAGPLEPFFTNISNYDPQDDKFEEVYPTFKNHNVRRADGEMLLIDGTEAAPTFTSLFRTIPNVPALFDLLTMYASEHFSTVKGRDTSYVRHGQVKKVTVNNRFSADELGGFTIPADGAASWVYIAPMINMMHPERDEAYKDAQYFWTNSRLADVIRETGADNNDERKLPENLTNHAQATPRKGFKFIGDFLQMNGDYSWFKDCVDMATIHSKFFSGVTNLSKIDTEEGKNIIIQWNVDVDSTRANARTEPTRWYPGMFKDLKARGRSIEEDIKDFDIKISAISVTNADVKIWDEDGDGPNQRNNFTARQCSGKYWEQHVVEYEDDTFVPILHAIEGQLTRAFYLPEGH